MTNTDSTIPTRQSQLTINTSAVQYARDLLDKALLTDKGLQLLYPTVKTATKVRHDMNRARVIDRELNRQVYPNPSDPMHGKSAFDVLVIRLVKNKTHLNPEGEPTATLLIQRSEVPSTTPLSVEEL